MVMLRCWTNVPKALESLQIIHSVAMIIHSAIIIISTLNKTALRCIVIDHLVETKLKG